MVDNDLVGSGFRKRKGRDIVHSRGDRGESMPTGGGPWKSNRGSAALPPLDAPAVEGVAT